MTQQLQDWDKQYIWHPFTQMQDYEQETPLVIERAEGMYLYDTDGTPYLDGVSSLWVNVHGHCVPEINEAIKEQLDKVAHSTLLGLASVPSIQLAKKLVEITPPGLDKVFYSDSGSTGVEVAIKMAYQYWQHIEGEDTQKVRMAHLQNSYHGDTIGSVSVGGMDLFHKIYSKLLFETIPVAVPEEYRCEELSWADQCFAELEHVFTTHAHELAAIVVEPLIQGAAGMLRTPEGYLQRVRELCDTHNVLMIVDEVATGFGRTGTMFACEQEDISPDILVLAKGLTGGYLPVAVTMTNMKIYNAFLDEYGTCKTFFHGHTYTGNALGCAAALASLELFETNDLMTHVNHLETVFDEELQVISELDHVGHVRRKGLMVGIELVEDKSTKTPYAWEDKVGVAVILKAREMGVIIRPLGSVIVLMPPLAISETQLRELCRVTYESILSVTS